MKVPKKGKDKSKVNKKGVVSKNKPKKEQVLVVAQEIKYARLLSGNEKNTRDRVLKALKKWLTNCFEKGYEFKEDDFTRVWKGLFYAMWMSDKPLIQEELCESISGILDLFPAEQLRPALLMAKAGFKTLASEWYGIDQHRMDKFLMLVRRYLRGSLRILNRCDWSLKSCEKYANMLTHGDGLFALKTPHYARNATSMLLHFVDCFLEELAKVSQGTISAESVSALLLPFTSYTCSGDVPTLCAACRRLLTALLRQSEPGLEYQDKTRAWQKMGCPGSGPDDLELASDEEHMNGDPSDEEMDDGVSKALDPRAGRVDVEVPLLPVPASLLANTLRDLLANSASKAHKRVKICLQRFETLAAGTYPLRVAAPELDSLGVAALKPKRSVRALRALEAKIKSDTDELKLRGLSRKHRKRLLRKTRAGISVVDEMANITTHKKKHQNGEWLVESTNKAEDDTSNKENQNNKKNKKTKDKTQKRKLETQNGDVNSKKKKVDEKKGKNKSKENLSKHSKESLSKESTKESSKMSLNKVSSKERVSKETKKDGKVKEIILNGKIKEKDTNKQVQKQIQKESPKKGKEEKKSKKESPKAEPPKLLINKLKHYSKSLQKDKKQDKTFQKQDKTFQKQDKTFQKQAKNFQKGTNDFDTPKKVKFVLKNNSMQKPVDYYKSVRQSPSIPFDSAKKPTKTNLKVSTPSPINPFFKKKLRMKH